MSGNNGASKRPLTTDDYIAMRTKKNAFVPTRFGVQQHLPRVTSNEEFSNETVLNFKKHPNSASKKSTPKEDKIDDKSFQAASNCLSESSCSPPPVVPEHGYFNYENGEIQNSRADDTTGGDGFGNLWGELEYFLVFHSSNEIYNLNDNNLMNSLF